MTSRLMDYSKNNMLVKTHLYVNWNIAETPLLCMSLSRSIITYPISLILILWSTSFLCLYPILRVPQTPSFLSYPTLSVSLLVSLSLYLSLSLSLSFCRSLCLCPSLFLSVCLSVSLVITSTFYLFTYLPYN